MQAYGRFTDTKADSKGAAPDSRACAVRPTAHEPVPWRRWPTSTGPAAGVASGGADSTACWSHVRNANGRARCADARAPRPAGGADGFQHHCEAVVCTVGRALAAIRRVDARAAPGTGPKTPPGVPGYRGV